MRRNIKLWMVAFSLLLASVSLSAQSGDRSGSSLAVRIGYSNILSGTSGLMSSKSSYVDDLSSGVSWDAEYYYRLSKLDSGLGMGFGFLYSGYTSRGEFQFSSGLLCSDRIVTHIFAPQIGIYIPVHDKVDLRANVGIGGSTYYNNSVAYGKDRRVEGGGTSFNYGIDAAYHFLSNIALSLNIQYIYLPLDEVDIKYHGEKYKVKYEDESLSLSRLNISLGLKYFF